MIYEVEVPYSFGEIIYGDEDPDGIFPYVFVTSLPVCDGSAGHIERQSRGPCVVAYDTTLDPDDPNDTTGVWHYNITGWRREK